MACGSKAELIALTEKEYAKLQNLIAPLSQAQAALGQDDVSIKHVIGHRAHWIDLFLGWYRDGAAGKKVYFPAEGYKWNDLKRYNADLRDKQSHLDWAAVCTLLQSRHNKLIQFLSDHSETDLYAGPMLGANNNWTPGRWAEAAGPSHYRSAAKYIRAILRSQG
ncbi:ClbS/DfsB family four-helix bundle protein [uncultured Tateyamaria sp.]|uniref:ClbS/DfsB family four-helix bundle protein n=1 Tax=Tateyamaria sp. 1078 TaxID=3417464 RepID=UPI00261E4BA8|nr:ClbS/DfsB family four-helix bundle protein [uncultured Tateyamaria sp.]